MAARLDLARGKVFNMIPRVGLILNEHSLGDSVAVSMRHVQIPGGQLSPCVSRARLSLSKGLLLLRLIPSTTKMASLARCNVFICT